jgi:hypothetical protein
MVALPADEALPITDTVSSLLACADEPGVRLVTVIGTRAFGVKQCDGLTLTRMPAGGASGPGEGAAPSAKLAATATTTITLSTASRTTSRLIAYSPP